MNDKIVWAAVVFSLFLIVGCSQGINNIAGGNSDDMANMEPEGAVVRVQVSSQSYPFLRPWDKKPTVNVTGLGAVIEGGLVLVTAQLVADSTYIELQKDSGGPRSPAKIRQVDYKANLALLEPIAGSFLSDLKSMEVEENLAVGEKVDVLFGKKDGKHERVTGGVSGIEVARYPFGSKLLLANIKADMASLTDDYSLPVIRAGKLCGLGMGYNQKSETLRAVSLPVIHHFLKDMADGSYEGLPFLGIDISPLEDEQLRNYLKLNEYDNGTYIYRVRPGSPGSQAGVVVGDVLLSVDGHSVGRFGKFEHATLGMIQISHYVSCARFSGDEVMLEIFRDGRKKQVRVRLGVASFGDSPVPSYLEGQAPKYMILGGLVLTELSRQYLQEWGPQWPIKAPEKLVNYYLNQWDLLRPGQRVVLLSHVLPTRAMIGYTDFDNMVVNTVNGKVINGIEDVGKALGQPLGRFHHLSFVEDEREIYIDRFTLEQENSFIQSRYGIARLRKLDDR